jgi:hypothetical protein
MRAPATGRLVAVMLLMVGCGGPAGLPLRVETTHTPAGIQLALLAPAGARINARLAPALELTDGRVLRFSASELTTDSTYFTSPPMLTLPAIEHTPHGVIRAGVCLQGERVCRTIELAL